MIFSLQVSSETLRRGVRTLGSGPLQSESVNQTAEVVRMTCGAATWLLNLTLLLLYITDSSPLFMPDSKELRELLSRYEQEADQNGNSNTAGNRTRRAILWSDREEILQLHNKLRGNVYPTASNMEYMVRHLPLPPLSLL